MNSSYVSKVPLSLYIHIPWCIKKCPYCDFNSHVSDAKIPEAQYIDQLIKDFQQDFPYVQGRPIQSIFIGGGTPSLFSAESYARLLDRLQSEVVFLPDTEVTIEANPGALEYGNLSAYIQAGINRISFGVQSFGESQLKVIGRIHTADEAEIAIQHAKEAGFQSINIDLMFGLPGQNVESAMNDLSRAISLAPQHLSWYELTIEKNTEFYRRPPVLPHEDRTYEIWQTGKARLATAGYHQYEVSAYAQPECRSRHNLNYWLFGDYIGIGAGAHGKVTLSNGGIIRTRKTRMPKDYLGEAGSLKAAINVPIPKEDLAVEFMMNALRLTGGFEIELYKERTGQSYEAVRQSLESATDKGWLNLDAGLVSCTPEGYTHLNQVLELFI